MIKTLSKLGINGTFLTLTKSIYKKSTANIIFNGERLNTFPQSLGEKSRISALAILIQQSTESLANAVRQEKEIEST